MFYAWGEYYFGMVKNHIIYNSYSPWRFDLGRAEGSFLFTDRGKRLIDFSSGWNVANLGWNNPEVSEAVIAQINRNVYAPMWTSDRAQNEYARALTDVLPDRLSAVGRATGGTEANEMAFKMARAKTGRSRIIGIRDSYHGQSFGAIAAGFRPDYVKAIAPVVPNFTQLGYPSSDRSSLSPAAALAKFSSDLEAELTSGDVAAIITEAGIVTGWGSTSVAPRGYLQVVRDLSARHGALLILDEVGTGFSRCGKLFALELEQVTPDFISLAKGMSNGAVGIGAVVTTDEIADATYAKATLTSTFGWTPPACAAALKTLEIHQRDHVWEKAATDGAYLMRELRSQLKSTTAVKAVRGLGLEIGIELTDHIMVKDVLAKAFSLGLHIAETNEGTLQLMPPLTIERATLDEGISILVNVLSETAPAK
jgi:acetylornithine/succinyldiaminopimelate/putrescine aminotransferase